MATTTTATDTDGSSNRITEHVDRSRSASKEPAQELPNRDAVNVDRSGTSASSSISGAPLKPVSREVEEKERRKGSFLDSDVAFQEQEDVRAKARRSLEEKFVKDGQHYHFKENGDVRAFKEENKALTTKFESDVVVRGMVDAAQMKGWKGINVEGTDDFKRLAWLEAARRDMTVTGYTPSEHDKRKLEELQLNRVEKLDERKPTLNTPINEPTSRTTPTTERAFEKVVGMGKDHYRFDKDESMSYYLKMRSDDGRERVVWGKDLERAASEMNVKEGDYIRLQVTQKTPVQVTANVRDADNHVVGKEVVTSRLNGWTIEKRDQEAAPLSVVNEQTRREVAAVKAIEERSGELGASTIDGMSKGQSRDAVRADRADYATVKTPALKERAAEAIAHNSDTQRNYRTELGSSDPALLAKAERSSNQLPDNSERKDENKEVVLASLDKVAQSKGVSPEIRAQVLEQASNSYDQRVAEGRPPVVQVFDVNAPRQVERQAREMPTDRTRDVTRERSVSLG